MILAVAASRHAVEKRRQVAEKRKGSSRRFEAPSAARRRTITTPVATGTTKGMK